MFSDADSEPMVKAKGSQGSSDFLPDSQDLQTARFEHMNGLLDNNNQPKILDHNFRMIRPLARLSPGKQNEMIQHIANAFAAIINTASEVKDDQINIWHRLKDGHYMEDRLEVAGEEKPDTTLRNIINSYNKTESGREGDLEKVQVRKSKIELKRVI